MVEFRKAIVPDEVEALCEFDRKAFGNYPEDIFSPETWLHCESYWMIVDGKTVGCTAFERDYYHDPDEPAIVMELELQGSSGLCPHCGKALRTPRAKQCRFCATDWH